MFVFAYHTYSFTHLLFHRINSSQACGPFVNYNTSWEVLPQTVDKLPPGIRALLFGLASEAFAVSFFVVTWCVFLSAIPKVLTVVFYLFGCGFKNFHFPPQLGHVLCDRTSRSSQESYQPTEGAARHGRFTLFTSSYIDRARSSF